MEIFKKKILNVMQLCNKELLNRKNGIEGESTIDQLTNIIIPELHYLVETIDNGNLPLRKDRYLISFANAFTVWGWDMNNPTELFKALVDLNNMYKVL